MKTLIERITIEEAREIKTNNEEYLLWLDDSEITEEEIKEYFRVTEYDSGYVNLEHKQVDFLIEGINF